MSERSEMSESRLTMDLQPHQQRVVDVKAELDIKRQKLIAFVDTPLFDSLAPDEQLLLKEQTIAMSRYSNILAMRIKKFWP